MAMPRSADASTSVTFALVNEATVFPLGDEASSKIVDNAGPKVVVSTGASFTAVTVNEIFPWAVLNAVVPPVEVMVSKLNREPLVPCVRSHAR